MTSAAVVVPALGCDGYIVVGVEEKAVPVDDFEEMAVLVDDSARQFASYSDENGENDWIHGEKELAAVLEEQRRTRHKDHHHKADRVQVEDTLAEEHLAVGRTHKSVDSAPQPKHDSKVMGA